MNEQYESLLNAVGALSSIGFAIRKEHRILSDFSDYLSQNESEISKFGSVSAEVQDYMDKYNFANGFLFDSMHKKLEALNPLRQKLAEMGERAKRLSNYPDRYGSKKAIEICKNLALTCMQKMRLDEIVKVAGVTDANTQKLTDILQLLERDSQILSKINELIVSNKDKLSKFKVYYAELQQYVKAFPHGTDDLSVVKERITTVEQLSSLLSSVDSAVNGIRPYYDRYDKGTVVANYTDVMNDMMTKMLYVEVGKYKTRLNGVRQKVQMVEDAFEKETKDLTNLQSWLKGNKLEMWLEDRESILKEVNNLMRIDPRKENYNIRNLNNKVVQAKQKKHSDVEKMVVRYPWLERNNKYKAVHTELMKKSLSYGQYQKAVKKIKKIRRNRMICTPLCLITIGIFHLPEIKCPTIE